MSIHALALLVLGDLVEAVVALDELLGIAVVFGEEDGTSFYLSSSPN